MRRWGILLVALLVLSLVPSTVFQEVSAATTTIQIEPTDDAYVKDSAPDSNYGSYYSLYVGTYNGAKERAYLKFDLSNLPENAVIVSATLHAYTYKGASSTPVNISVYAVSDDSWTEGSITWNTKPQEGALLDKDLIDTAGNHWSVWDVTDFVTQEFNGDKIVSFVLISDAEGSIPESIGYTSKDDTKYPDHHPYLKIVYTLPKNVQISSVEVPQLVWKGEETEILVTVNNSDTTDYSGFNLTVSVDNNIIYENKSFSIKAGEKKLLSIPWTPEELGTHEIAVTLKDEDGALLSFKTVQTEVGAKVPIQEIQSNTTDGDASAYSEIIVRTEGVVTTIGKQEFIIQNGTGPWSGLFIYVGNNLDDLLGRGLQVGSVVRVTGRVYEYYGLTEIGLPEEVEILGTAEVPEPVVLHTGDVAQEQWESVLVQVENATVKAVENDYWVVDDGSGEVKVSTYLYNPTSITPGQVYKYIRGVLLYSWGDYKITPRNADDVVLKIPEIVSLEVPHRYVGEGLINVTVRNNYEVSTNVTLKVTANGDVVYLKNLTLEGNEVRPVLVTWNPAEPGTYTVNATLMDRSGNIFDVEWVDVEVSYGVGLKSYEIPKVVLVDEPVEFNFTLFNNYSTAKTVNFTVLINGEPFYSNVSLVLESGEELNLNILWKAPRYGNYTVNATLKYEGVTVGEVNQKVYAQYGISPTGEKPIEAIEDAYSYYYSGTDFSWKDYYKYYADEGTRYELAVGNSSEYARERTYLKFNLSSISGIANITFAKLCVYTFYVKSPMEVGVYAVEGSWSEKQKPSEPPELGDLIDTTVMENGGEWYCWNVTDYVKGVSGNGTVSVALKMINEDQDNVAWMASRENPSNRPYLNVTYSIPMEIKNFENVTVAVIGDANVSSENGTIVVELDGESYTFSPSSTNVFVNATGFNPKEPSLLAYWKSTITGYSSEPAGESTRRMNARKVVKTTTTKVTVDLAMAEDGTAVLVIPLLGDEVVSVEVVKDGENVALHENAADDEIGYYYLTDSHLVVVLKKDPTQVVATFETKKIIENPTAISTLYGVSLYYSRYLHKNDPYLEGLYANFTNLTAELRKYNVTLFNVPVEEINEMMAQYKESLSNVPEDIYDFYKYKTRVYSIFINARRAFLMYNELVKKLELWNPVLEETLAKVKNSGGEVPIVVPTPPGEVSVLIDASHGQYYVNNVGITSLVTRIQEELGWSVTINNESPITYDLLSKYTVVIILDPREDYTPQEVAAIKQYVENGGGLFIAGEWFKYSNVDNFNSIVGDYGIRFNADELMDDEKNSGKPYYPFVGIYNKAHPAMKFVPDDWTIYYNGGTLTISGNAVWLIKGYDTSYSVDADGNVVMAKGTNPILAAAVEAGRGRIIAYGSSKALSDDYHQKYIKSNWPFIKGALLWLAHQE